MTKNINGFIALPKAVAVEGLGRFMEDWNGGGEERSDAGLEAYYRSKLEEEEAPKTTGWFWRKRPTTADERRAWADRAWSDKHWQSRAMPYRFGLGGEQHRRRERAENIRGLLIAAKAAPPETLVYVNSDLWAWAQRAF